MHFRVEEEVLLSAFAAHAESVIVPSAASAAKPIVSERVGCGWIVRPMSSASPNCPCVAMGGGLV